MNEREQALIEAKNILYRLQAAATGPVNYFLTRVQVRLNQQLDEVYADIIPPQGGK